jgi:quercetin dioxygenase-like cupin family protein
MFVQPQRGCRDEAGSVMSPEVGFRATMGDGAIAMLESVLEPHVDGPPLHVNPSLNASFYVLEGRLSFQIGDTYLTALPGASLRVPSRTPHTYANHSDQVVRVLIACTPDDQTREVPRRTEGEAAMNESIHRTDILGPPLAEAVDAEVIG